ncbi:hypothetical protein EDB81DRAFT_881593 [Dactylonectria macrodidyma]|uniref:LITAF domain-containing protein n=1 Tax=Dactylonectria macrodidyma TaxID=307937 RepID=A0A9P9F4Q5_9HYPO|nr:hypothetical protein EDB81DRAFT_881593 [Dactylonectria macrodidyma]
MSSRNEQASPTVSNVSPPVYTKSPVDCGGSAKKTPAVNSTSPRSPEQMRAPNTRHMFIDDGGLPEVVIFHQPDKCDSPPETSDSYNQGVPPAIPNPMVDTVTPLHLLDDQPDTVDCPFCRRRTETRVKKSPSLMTHVAATTLLITTVGGAVAPYARNWKSHVSHYCENCNRKVAYRRQGERMQPLGTPDHLREVSKYPSAGSREN